MEKSCFITVIREIPVFRDASDGPLAKHLNGVNTQNGAAIGAEEMHMACKRMVAQVPENPEFGHLVHHPFDLYVPFIPASQTLNYSAAHTVQGCVSLL